ncbi:DNA polymerase III subunit gamma and tau [Dactylosporangium roseum]|uniref:DNA-directed DNA polymerase n=1 Tax=Dactylosporangium roseum TaxID=47989 RepID=A0ABY5Z5M7_9ACTN|nr:DNA polymerase III subunit gamma and tau [Dactylosporangium roseum]UWZ36315.1 DNA polymerase III subunit gamma and tau [Dactylosporangium roseum]
MALALYRKYRPRTFAEVIGQEHVTEPLSQALRSGRLNHAYLFSGPRGCGKTSSARILARSLNCERGPTPEPCGECQSCRDLAPDGAGSIDVIEIDAASHGGVDDARDLRERAIFAPVSSRFKVYVIDEAHMVSSAGFNALLKLVEEPPDYVKFVFATTEPEKVLGTIKSRTHHYPFRLIPPGVLRPYLEQLTAAEGVTVEPTVFPLVVRAGAGSARDTLSVLDQLIAGAGPEGVTYGRAVALLGVTDVSLIDEMCDALAADDGRGAYGVIDRLVEAGHDPRRFASDLLERLRDLIVLQQVPDAVDKGLLDAPHDQLERMSAQATQLGQASLSRFADIVHNGLTEMRGTTAPRLLLELITARMLLPGADDSSAALLQRLERMERRLMAGGVPAPAVPAEAYSPAPAAGPAPAASPASTPVPASAPVPVPAPVQASVPVESAPVQRPAPAPGPAPAAAPGAGGLDAAAVRRVWADVLTLVSGKSKKAAAIVREATVQDVEGSTLVLGFKYVTHANMLSNSPDVLISALQELLGGRWQVRCEVGGQPGGGGGSRPATPKPTPQPSGPSAPPGPAQAPHQAGPASIGEPVGGSRVGAQAAGEWPTPAVPGGVGAGAVAVAAAGGMSAAGGGPGGSNGGDAGAGGDWPTPATPSGAARSAVAQSSAEGWPTPATLGGAPSAAPGGGRPAQAAPGGGWPTPATPGGAAGPASAPGVAEGWPTPVTPGGVATAASVLADPGAAVRGGTAAGTGAGSRPGAGSPVPTGPAGRPRTGGSTAIEMAREAARAAASGQRRSAAAQASTAGAAESAWDGAVADEPPFDPDYDSPVADPRFPGLDPGDELLDDATVVRETSEEAALRLLTEALGAEKIGETTG